MGQNNQAQKQYINQPTCCFSRRYTQQKIQQKNQRKPKANKNSDEIFNQLQLNSKLFLPNSKKYDSKACVKFNKPHNGPRQPEIFQQIRLEKDNKFKKQLQRKESNILFPEIYNLELQSHVLVKQSQKLDQNPLQVQKLSKKGEIESQVLIIKKSSDESTNEFNSTRQNSLSQNIFKNVPLTKNSLPKIRKKIIQNITKKHNISNSFNFNTQTIDQQISKDVNFKVIPPIAQVKQILIKQTLPTKMIDESNFNGQQKEFNPSQNDNAENIQFFSEPSEESEHSDTIQKSHQYEDLFDTKKIEALLNLQNYQPNKGPYPEPLTPIFQEISPNVIPFQECSNHSSKNIESINLPLTHKYTIQNRYEKINIEQPSQIENIKEQNNEYHMKNPSKKLYEYNEIHQKQLHPNIIIF